MKHYFHIDLIKDIFNNLIRFSLKSYKINLTAI